MGSAGSKTCAGDCDRPVFPHHPDDVRILLNLLQKGFHKDKAAKERLAGSRKTAYVTQNVPIDNLYCALRFIPARELRNKTGDASRQGSGAEAERMSHVFSEPAEHAKCIPMEDILKAEVRCHTDGDSTRSSARVLVLGGAGSGKTMSFTRKATLDWARGRLWPDIELLFALPMRQRDVSSAKRLKELLRLEHLGMSSKESIEQILAYVCANWSRVCLLLDGLDEVKLGECSAFIKNIVKGDALQDAHVIITSRPSEEVMNLVSENPFNLRLELMGFRRQDIERYVSSVLSSEDTVHFMEQLERSPQLTAFMQTPINCANACALYRSGHTKLPATIPAMVSSILRSTIKQTQQKRETPKAVAEEWDDIAEDLKAHAMELAAFAFNTLVQRVTVFDLQHFQDHRLSEAAKDLGLLTAYDDPVLDPTPQWQFTHLTMQEALAARHIAKQLSAVEVSRCQSLHLCFSRIFLVWFRNTLSLLEPLPFLRANLTYYDWYS